MTLSEYGASAGVTTVISGHQVTYNASTGTGQEFALDTTTLSQTSGSTYI
ncbi:MAG: hypothetical protein AB7I27_17245 [Bacteriovoracaceae bacterium]